MFFDQVPDEVILIRDIVSNGIDFSHALYPTKYDIQEVSEKLKPGMKKDGLFWIS